MSVFLWTGGLLDCGGGGLESRTNGRVPQVFTTRDVFQSPAVVSVLLVRLHSLVSPVS